MAQQWVQQTRVHPCRLATNRCIIAPPCSLSTQRLAPSTLTSDTAVRRRQLLPAHATLHERSPISCQSTHCCCSCRCRIAAEATTTVYPVVFCVRHCARHCCRRCYRCRCRRHHCYCRRHCYCHLPLPPPPAATTACLHPALLLPSNGTSPPRRSPPPMRRPGALALTQASWCTMTSTTPT